MDIPRMGLSTEFPYRAHVEVDEFLQVGDTFRGRVQTADESVPRLHQGFEAGALTTRPGPDINELN